MKRSLPCIVLLSALPWMWACGSSYPLFLNTNLSEAQSLKKHCESRGITSLEVQKADSLAAAARAKAREGKENEAYWMADASATYYRLAVAKHELASARTTVAGLRKELAAAREQLNTYKEVLNELENMKNP
ncbi:MAG: hypothetical protein GF418_00845 [Chitinivibrionales bacterium]|nr:hypothetical protein [Chitinivibrionales bacterium]MBD3394148.1 hypothetical protein [Chitinivibrionales bacterium]